MDHVRQVAVVQGPLPPELADTLRLLSVGGHVLGSDWSVGRKMPGSRLIWETRSLASVAPAVVASCCVVHVRSHVVDHVAWVKATFPALWARCTVLQRKAIAIRP